MNLIPSEPLAIKLFSSNPKLVWDLFHALISDSSKYTIKLYYINEIRQENGDLDAVKITYEGSDTFELKIQADWQFHFYKVRKKGEIKGWSMANGEELFQENHYTPLFIAYPHKLVALLLKHNLFKIQN